MTNSCIVKGKHICVSGGSSGIGLAIVLECLELGAKCVSVLSRKVTKWIEDDHLKHFNDYVIEFKSDAVVSLAKTGADEAKQTVRAINVDVTCQSQVLTAFSILGDYLADGSTSSTSPGDVEILVCCAGGAIASVVENQAEQMEWVIDLNLIGTINCVLAVLPSMKKAQCGGILLVASEASHIGIYGYTAYCAAKFGVRGFADALRMEVEQLGIHVCLLFPPSVDTPGYRVECINKPLMTKMVEGTSTLLSPEAVAKYALRQFQKKKRRISVGIIGYCLALLSSGCSKADGWVDLIGFIFLAPFLRIFVSFMFWYYDRNIRYEVNSSMNKYS